MPSFPFNYLDDGTKATNQLLVFLCVIFGFGRICSAISEAELLELPLDQRWKVIQETASPELREELSNANNLALMKLKVGEDRWESYQQTRVIMARGFTGFAEFIGNAEAAWGCHYAREYRLLNDWAGEDVEVRREAFEKSFKELGGGLKEFQQFCKDALSHELLYLAPSPEAFALDRLANQKSRQLEKKVVDLWVNTVFSKEEIARTERELKALMQRVKSLPKLTKEEVELEFKRLPLQIPTR